MIRPLLLLALCLTNALLTAPAAKPASPAAILRQALERPHLPLDPDPGAKSDVEGLRTERLTIASEAGVRVPVLLIRRAEEAPPRPAVIVLHGLGGNKEGQRPLLEQLANRGFVAAAIDARYHGDRKGDLNAA